MKTTMIAFGSIMAFASGALANVGGKGRSKKRSCGENTEHTNQGAK